MKLEDEFNKFIKKWCGPHYPHLIDSDENAGERFRQLIREERQRVKEAIQKLKKSICLNPDYGKVPEIYAKNKLAVDVLETLEIELGLEDS